MIGPLGEILAALSALSFAIFNVTIAGMTKDQVERGVLFSVIVTIGFSLVLFLILEAGRIQLPMTGETLAGIGMFAFAGISAMVVGRNLTYLSTRKLGAIRASSIKRLNPFFSVLLAAVFLAESIGRLDILGLIAIAAAFAILIRESLKHEAGAHQVDRPLSYLVGAMAAFAYAVAYIARKAGLDLLHAPAFGTFVSAVAGFLGFGGIALVVRSYRPMFVNSWRNIDRQIFMAAVMVSCGQILMFAALNYESVATVVLISSLEIFLSIFLAAYVLRIEKRPGAAVFIAACAAFAGAILVAT